MWCSLQTPFCVVSCSQQACLALCFSLQQCGMLRKWPDIPTYLPVFLSLTVCHHQLSWNQLRFFCLLQFVCQCFSASVTQLIVVLRWSPVFLPCFSSNLCQSSMVMCALMHGKSVPGNYFVTKVWECTNNGRIWNNCLFFTNVCIFLHFGWSVSGEQNQSLDNIGRVSKCNMVHLEKRLQMLNIS